MLLKDNYSDIQEKINYYNNNPKKAFEIIRNANEYVAQFKDIKKRRSYFTTSNEKIF